MKDTSARALGEILLLLCLDLLIADSEQVRFERLLDRIRLYALSEIEEYV